MLAGCDKGKAPSGESTSPDAAASSAGALLGADFEGEVTATMTQKAVPNRPAQLVFAIKKPKYRMDMTQEGQLSSVVFSLPEKKGWLLVHPQRTAMVMDLQTGLGITDKPAAPKTTPKIDKTGKKDAVAGYACELWNITNGGRRVEACVAEGIDWIDLSDIGWAPTNLSTAAFATQANHFPLRAISYDAKGAEESRIEATKVEKKKLDDAKLGVPADYRVIDMSKLQGGLPFPVPSK